MRMIKSRAGRIASGIVCAALLFVGIAMIAHHFVFPNAHTHPSDVLAGFCILIGVVRFLPMEVEAAFKFGRELLPWQPGDPDRRDQ